RRGPDGEAGMMVALQNKYTSDELSRENQTFCKRIRACRSDCANGAACTFVPAGDPADAANRCLPEGADPSHVLDKDGNLVLSNQALLELLYPRCGPSVCTSSSIYRDVDFDGSECKPYSFSGAESNTYCFAADPPPAAEERCGDGFLAPVRLSTDWELFKIPFSEFRQVGWGKPARTMDLHSVFSVAFQFSVGFADVYVDNVSFYRNRQ
ncbi:MAG TPA: hypothetical protein VGP93_03045, partial [Polyangiaceae bacterium]|nr:hypothetical protein [Polyangiaceae bacterium]